MFWQCTGKQRKTRQRCTDCEKRRMAMKRNGVKLRMARLCTGVLRTGMPHTEMPRTGMLHMEMPRTVTFYTALSKVKHTDHVYCGLLQQWPTGMIALTVRWRTQKRYTQQ